MQEMQDINGLYNEVREIITSARQNAVRSVDFSRVQMYWKIARHGGCSTRHSGCSIRCD